MLNYKEVIKNKIKNFTNESIMEILNQKKLKPLNDWRNWGNNEFRLIAEEAFERNLIK